jgi:hypothetical protein
MRSDTRALIEGGKKTRFGFGSMQSRAPEDTSETIQTYLRRNEASK